MKVAVIGAGGMGRGIARLSVGAHEVSIGSRDLERAIRLAEELGAAGGGGYGDVATGADVVFLTVPWTAVDETLSRLGDLRGKVLVDVTNPFVGGKLELHADSSGAERIQAKVPGASVVKGWNTIYEPVLAAVGTSAARRRPSSSPPTTPPPRRRWPRSLATWGSIPWTAVRSSRRATSSAC